MTLREQLREHPLPGETEAAARAWPVVEAALAERVPARRPRRVALRLALVAALACAGLVAALTPAGASVGEWIGDRFATGDDSAAPAFAGLPPGGSALAISRSGAYAVRPDGSSRRLGSFSEAGWSPRGLHVVGTDGRRLVAVDPAGTVKWTRARPTRVHDPAWAPGDGFVVAYLEGTSLRAVGGNGDGDRLLRRHAGPVTPAWRPGGGHVLTYAFDGAGLETVDADSGRTLWRTRSLLPRGSGPYPVALTWARGGRRLVALWSRTLTVLDARGRLLRVHQLPGRGRALALHPSGRRAAVAVGGPGGTRVLELPLSGGKPNQLFQGGVDGLAWSQDGRHLLLAWRDADQWLLLDERGRVTRALHNVSAELGTAGGFPRLAGWCCSG
jgi:hypothetical protein